MPLLRHDLIETHPPDVRSANLTRTHGIAARFANGAMWSTVGTVIGQGTNLAVSLITARLLGTVHFGEFAMVQSTVGMLSIFAGLALGLTTTKYVAEFRASHPKRAEDILALTTTLALISGALMTILLCGTSVQTAEVINAPQLAPILRLASASLLFGGVAGVQNGILAGVESFKALARLNIARGFLYLPLAAIGVWRYGLRGAILALLLSSFAGVVIGEIAVRDACRARCLRYRWYGGWGEWKTVGTFTVPSVLSSLSVTPITWCANTILAHQSHGYQEVGLLNAANQWRTATMFLPAIFVQVALPLLSSAAADSTSKFSLVLEGTQSLTTAVVFPAAALVMFLSPVISKLYGSGFSAVAPVIEVVAYTAAVLAIGAAIAPAIQAKGRMWLALGSNLCWGGITIAFVFITAARLGALSVAYGSAIGYVFTTLGTFLYMREELPAGMVIRVCQATAVATLMLLLSTLIPPETKTICAAPALSLALLMCWYMTPLQLRQSIAGRIPLRAKRVPRRS